MRPFSAGLLYMSDSLTVSYSLITEIPEFTIEV